MTEVERKRRLEKLAGFVLPKGNYTLQDHIATSNMSVVYKALDNASRRYVAIKILLDEKFYWRFENEFELSYGLTVTNIAVTTRADLVGEIIFDGEGEITLRYLVMKWLSGLSLLDIIRKNREDPKPTQQLLEDSIMILRKLAPALDTIHQKGIYHRDIKPSNIRFNTDPNERNEPYLLDFGIAKKGQPEEETLVVGRESTTVGEYTGTPRYMPPEQWDGSVNTGASDQYALAITIYELISDGNSPFRKAMQSTSPTSPSGNGSNPANVYAWQKAHREAEPTSIQEYRFDVPDAAWQVLKRAMSKDASQRYENIKHFQEAFQGAVHPFSIKPRPTIGMTTEKQPIYRPPQEAPTRPKAEPVPPKTRSRLPIIIAIIVIAAAFIGGAFIVLPSILGTPTATPAVTVATIGAEVAVISTETPISSETSVSALTPTQQSTETSQAPTETPIPASSTPVPPSSTSVSPESASAAGVVPTITPSPIPASATHTRTSMPSDTPLPSATNTPNPTDSPSRTPTRRPSNTPVPPTATPLPPSASPTTQLIPTTTPKPPTATRTPSSTPTRPPTLTPTPTASPTATLTDTPTLTATPTIRPAVKDFLELFDQITRAGSSAARFDCAAYVEAYEGLQNAVASSQVEAEVAIVAPLVDEDAETLPALYEFCNREQNRTENRLQLPSNLSNNQFRDLRRVVGEAKRAIQALR